MTINDKHPRADELQKCKSLYRKMIGRCSFKVVIKDDMTNEKHTVVFDNIQEWLEFARVATS